MKRTVDGIKVDVDPRAINDLTTLGLIAEIAAPVEDDSEALGKIPKLIELGKRLFGDGFDDVYHALEEKGGGYVDGQSYMTFVNDVAKACNSKNS